MGANRWWAGDTFPPPSRPLPLYLTSGGRANTQDGDGQLVYTPPAEAPPDGYYYDPGEPVASLGGRSCCFPDSAPMGPYDQRPVHRYPIVLVYRSEPLRDDLCIMGAVEATIHLESTADDTDVVVQLCDERADGRVLNVVEGILRTAGEHPPYRVELGMTAFTFRAGHRIRVAITSSLHPAYDRNHNGGGREVTQGADTRQVAWQTVHHDAARPSSITLPVV
jgi:putative CocE/NonD family hydrolase